MHSIVLDDHSIQYDIRRSRRARYIRLLWRSDGHLVITLPAGVDSTNVEEILRQHRRWILRRLQKVSEKQNLRPPFELTDGACLPVHKEQYRLKLIQLSGKRAFWQCLDHTLELHLPDFTLDWIAPGIELWYRQVAEKFLIKRVGFWSEQMELSAKQVRVKNQQSLWGSCSRQGSLNFNWRIMLLTPAAADYLIIHELAHLRELNHSQRFWRLVAQHCPNYRLLKNELASKSHWLRFPVY